MYQTWYRDNSDSSRWFYHICTLWEYLFSQDTSRSYLPEPTKHILFTGFHNLRWAIEYFSNLNFKFVSVNCYLGSCFGGLEG